MSLWRATNANWLASGVGDGLSFEQVFVIKGSELRAIGDHGMIGDANGLTFGGNGALYGSSDGLYKLNPKPDSAPRFSYEATLARERLGFGAGVTGFFWPRPIFLACSCRFLA